MHHLRKKRQLCSNSSKVSSKKHHVSSLHQFLEGSDHDLLNNGKELNDKRAAEEERKQLVPRRKRPKWYIYTE